MLGMLQGRSNMRLRLAHRRPTYGDGGLWDDRGPLLEQIIDLQSEQQLLLHILLQE